MAPKNHKHRGDNHGGNNDYNQNNNSTFGGNNNHNGNNNMNNNNNGYHNGRGRGNGNNRNNNWNNNGNDRNNGGGGGGGGGGGRHGGYNNSNNNKNYNGHSNNNNRNHNHNNQSGQDAGISKGKRYGDQGTRFQKRPNNRDPGARDEDAPRNIIFSGGGPRYHGTGRDSRFTESERKTAAARPFSSVMPFSIRVGPTAEAESDLAKARYREENPESAGESEGSYMDYILHVWAKSPNRKLSPVFRSHGLKQMLEYGTVEEIAAEVFHFLCGIYQSRYGDGYMRDDMVLCDCDGHVPRCFTTVFMELARRADYLEKQVAKAGSTLLECTDPGMPSHDDTQPPRPPSSSSDDDVEMGGDNIG